MYDETFYLDFVGHEALIYKSVIRNTVIRVNFAGIRLEGPINVMNSLYALERFTVENFDFMQNNYARWIKSKTQKFQLNSN